jgi:hypothetical protein
MTAHRASTFESYVPTNANLSLHGYLHCDIRKCLLLAQKGHAASHNRRNEPKAVHS